MPGLRRWPAFEADSACGSMVLYDHLCPVFPRGARKNRTPTEIRHRFAEGKNADRVTPVNESPGKNIKLVELKAQLALIAAAGKYLAGLEVTGFERELDSVPAWPQLHIGADRLAGEHRSVS